MTSTPKMMSTTRHRRGMRRQPLRGEAWLSVMRSIRWGMRVFGMIDHGMLGGLDRTAALFGHLVGELRTEQQDDRGEVDPEQDDDHGAGGAIGIVHTRGADVETD